jgi:parallel beta-helix repeat protein
MLYKISNTIFFIIQKKGASMKHFFKQKISLRKPLHVFWVIAITISFVTGCKKDMAPADSKINAQTQSEDELTAKWGLPDIVVHKGESIQAAVDKAKNGMLILIEPGIYKEAIVVNKPGIKLIGKFSFSNAVVIKNPGEEKNGIRVRGNGDGFVLANVTVEGFESNGVFLDSADNYIISHVKAVDNEYYGIFPVHCNHGLIEFCIATGSSDTGIYVGQSTDVKMQFNSVYANVNGLEVENSSDVDVVLNQAYDNVAGILVDLLSGKDVKTSKNVRVRFNHLYNNNHVNFGEPGELESFVPSGLGLLILGTDKTIAEQNTINDNQFAGIVVFSTLVLSSLAGIPPDSLADIEPNPDGVKITKNILRHNGFNPPVIPGLPLPGVDLLYDGSGTNNCWSNNIFKTSYPSPLPSCN